MVKNRGERLSYMAILILFCILFAFRIPLLYNSVVLILLAATVLLCTGIYKFDRLFRLFGSVEFQLPLALLGGISMLALIYPLLHGSNDFTRLGSVASVLFVMGAIILLMPILAKTAYHAAVQGNHIALACKYIWFAFVLQAVIIALCIASPAVLSIVSLFQSPDEIARALKYEGVRGLAMSGGQFFSLSAAFCLAQLCGIYYIYKAQKVSIFALLSFPLVMICGLTAGRTSIIGTAFVVVFIVGALFTTKSAQRRSLRLLLVMSGAIVVGVAGILSSSYRDFFLDKFVPFAFEFVVNYFDEGSIATASTDILSRMYWALSPYEFMLGYGRYSNPDGTTFMFTDGGYMRNALLFGSIGLAMVMAFHIATTLLIYRHTEKRRIDKLFVCLFFMMGLLLHYKGEVIAHLVSFQTIIFLMLFTAAYFRGGRPVRWSAKRNDEIVAVAHASNMSVRASGGPG